MRLRLSEGITVKALGEFLPCKKLLACVVAATLAFGSCPLAYADTSEDGASAEEFEETDGFSGDEGAAVASDEDGGDADLPGGGPEAFEDEAIDADQGDEDEDGAKDLELEELSLRASTSIWSYDYDQGAGTVVEFEFPNIGDLIETGKADAVRVKASMQYDGIETRTVHAQASLSEIVSAGGKFAVDFEDYGKFKGSVSYLKNGKPVDSEEIPNLGVVSDRYVIAPICSTYPLAAFSLSFRSAMTQGGGAPAIVLLERPNAYDWSNLPGDMRLVPYLSEQEAKSAPSDPSAARRTFVNRCSAFAAYIDDLYEMNPRAQFDFWFSDSCLGIAHSFVYANNVKNYSITVLSDVDKTYENYRSAYGAIDPYARHDSLVKAWSEAKDNAKINRCVDAGFELQNAGEYLMAMLDCEDNARLLVPSKDGFDSGHAEFDKAVRSNSQIVEKDAAALWDDLQSQGDVAVSEFEELYLLGGDCFASADAAGKQVMLLLGDDAAQSAEFVDYASLACEYFGGEYAYFYPSETSGRLSDDAESASRFEKLGVNVLDEAVPAEVALRLHPETTVSGYSSSLLSLSENARMVFGSAKESSLASGAAGVAAAECFVSPVGSETDPKIVDLCEKGKRFYLVEFSDKMLEGKDFDFALWNATDGKLAYYRLDTGGNPVPPVDDPDTPDDPKAGFEGGLCTIETSLRSNMMVDVKSASTLNGANVQLYSGNVTPAQRFRFEKTGDGYFEIVNVKSGLVLDVQSAGKRSGTNVWQYGRNGTNAQKWKIEPTGDADGSYYVISKCNGLYLDVASAKTGNGNNIQVYAGNKTQAQKFYLNAITSVLPSGTYAFKSALDSLKALDVSGASKTNGANVQLYQGNGTPAQKLQVLYDANTGYYSCKFVCSGKMLDVSGGKTFDRTNVQQYKPNGTWAQRWNISKDASGRYRVTSSLSGKALDVANGKSANRTNVWIYAANNTRAQSWYIERV